MKNYNSSNYLNHQYINGINHPINNNFHYSLCKLLHYIHYNLNLSITNIFYFHLKHTKSPNIEYNFKDYTYYKIHHYNNLYIPDIFLNPNLINIHPIHSTISIHLNFHKFHNYLIQNHTLSMNNLLNSNFTYILSNFYHRNFSNLFQSKKYIYFTNLLYNLKNIEYKYWYYHILHKHQFSMMNIINFNLNNTLFCILYKILNRSHCNLYHLKIYKYNLYLMHSLD